MRILNGLVYHEGALRPLDIRVERGKIASLAPRGMLAHGEDEVLDAAGMVVSPGFVDIHVHLRQPGFEYKETIATGTAAAARGGYTTVCAMPNLSPAPDSPARLAPELAAIAADAAINVLPYGCITREEKGQALADLDGLAPLCCAFSDDGKGVQSRALMKDAMARAAALGKVIVAHCEDESLLAGGCIHAGPRAAALGLPGIVSESETAEVRRDIALCEETGARLHICHVSAKESLAAIAAAKEKGLPVTCEATPHQLLLCDEDIAEDSGRFKMNPPLRRPEDRNALVAGVQAGVVDAIVTDHAPHSAEEKAKGLAGSAMGVSGLECAFGVLNAGLVETGRLSLEKLLHLMTAGPAGVLGLSAGVLEEGAPADLVVLDPGARWTVRGAEFVSKGKSTPFEGCAAVGRPVCTLVGGAIIFREELF